MSDLPFGWLCLPLEELGQWLGGGTPSKSNPDFWGGDLPWVSPKDMKSAYITDALDKITAAAVHGSATNLIPPESILIVTRSGILRHTLPVAVSKRSVAINQDLKALVPTPIADAEFIAWQLKSLSKAILAECAKSGTTVDSVDFNKLKAFTVAVPPLAEQRRIVEKLDALTARTARARADLDRIPALAARYKQAVLAKALSGELTGNQTQWETKPVSELIDSIVGGKNLKCEERPPQAHELGVVKVSAVSWGSFDPHASKTLPSDFLPLEKTRINIGDFLISRANTLELVGAVVIVDHTPQNLFLSDKVLRLEMPETHKSWLMWFLRSPDGRAAIEGGSSGNQLSMRNLSQDALKKINVPWPDAETRLQIVLSIERAFTDIDRMVTEAAAARRLLDRLDQAVLAKAFRGELVPQDPSDEPARALLDRIRAERAAAPKAKRGRRKAAA